MATVVNATNEDVVYQVDEGPGGGDDLRAIVAGSKEVLRCQVQEEADSKGESVPTVCAGYLRDRNQDSGNQVEVPLQDAFVAQAVLSFWRHNNTGERLVQETGLNNEATYRLTGSPGAYTVVEDLS